MRERESAESNAHARAKGRGPICQVKRALSWRKMRHEMQAKKRISGTKCAETVAACSRCCGVAKAEDVTWRELPSSLNPSSCASVSSKRVDCLGLRDEGSDSRMAVV
eukprot:3364347-Rhodomonas_salina.1